MNNKLKQKIEEETLKLPKEWQEVICSFDWEKPSKEIGKKYLLTESEINDLQIEIGLVLVGLEEQNSFALNVENNIGTSKNEAEKITEEVNQKIFKLLLKKRSALVKDNLTIEKHGWDKTINFIVSGGDYSVFIEK